MSEVVLNGGGMTLQKLGACLAFSVLSFISQAQAGSSQAIGKLQSDPFRILVVESPTGISLAVSATNSRLTPTNAEVHLRENPSRLVIDLPIQKASLATDSLAISHPMISQLRVGSHPGKTRFVVDLKASVAIDPIVSPIDELGALLIHLRKVSSAPARAPKETAETAKAPTELSSTSKKEITPSPLPSQAPSARMKLADGAFINRDGVIVHRGEENSNATAPQQKRLGAITGFSFAPHEDSELDALQIAISGVTKFSLTPLSDSRYELVLENSSLEGTIPQQIGIGFESLSVDDVAPNTVVQIEVHQGVSLAATLDEQTLTLRPKRLAK